MHNNIIRKTLSILSSLCFIYSCGKSEKEDISIDENIRDKIIAGLQNKIDTSSDENIALIKEYNDRKNKDILICKENYIKKINNTIDRCKKNSAKTDYLFNTFSSLTRSTFEDDLQKENFLKKFKNKVKTLINNAKNELRKYPDLSLVMKEVEKLENLFLTESQHNNIASSIETILNQIKTVISRSEVKYKNLLAASKKLLAEIYISSENPFSSLLEAMQSTSIDTSKITKLLRKEHLSSAIGDDTSRGDLIQYHEHYLKRIGFVNKFLNLVKLDTSKSYLDLYWQIYHLNFVIKNKSNNNLLNEEVIKAISEENVIVHEFNNTDELDACTEADVNKYVKTFYGDEEIPRGQFPENTLYCQHVENTNPGNNIYNYYILNYTGIKDKKQYFGLDGLKLSVNEYGIFTVAP